MKKFSIIALVLMMAFTLVLAGCGGNEPSNVAPKEEPKKEEPKKEEAKKEEPKEEEPVVNNISGEITVWGFWDFTTKDTNGESMITRFNEEYPNVKVNPVIMDWQGQHDKLKTVLAAGDGVPDVAMIESGFWGDFTSMPGLDNLLDAPYNMGDFEADIPEGNFKKMLSLDGKSMFGFGVDFPARVTYYRYDHFEEAGLPSDPQELVEYMQDWKNVLNMAEMLKAKGRYMFWGANDPINSELDSSTPFNEKLEFQWNSEKMAQLLDIAKEIKQRKLSSDIGFWDDEGKQAIKSGKMSAVYIGTWGDGQLKGEWGGQDLAGKWRLTVLPGGIYAGNGGTFWSVPTKAKNKDAAAAWVRYHGIPNLEQYEKDMALGGTWVPSYLPAWNLEGFDVAHDPFFGDQPVKAAIKEIIKLVPGFTKTPLDSKAREIFSNGINEAIDKNLDSKATLQKIKADVESQMAKDIADLKAKLKIN